MVNQNHLLENDYGQKIRLAKRNTWLRSIEEMTAHCVELINRPAFIEYASQQDEYEFIRRQLSEDLQLLLREIRQQNVLLLPVYLDRYGSLESDSNVNSEDSFTSDSFSPYRFYTIMGRLNEIMLSLKAPLINRQTSLDMFGTEDTARIWYSINLQRLELRNYLLQSGILTIDSQDKIAKLDEKVSSGMSTDNYHGQRIDKIEQSINEHSVVIKRIDTLEAKKLSEAYAIANDVAEKVRALNRDIKALEDTAKDIRKKLDPASIEAEGKALSKYFDSRAKFIRYYLYGSLVLALGSFAYVFLSISNIYSFFPADMYDDQTYDFIAKTAYHFFVVALGYTFLTIFNRERRVIEQYRFKSRLVNTISSYVINTLSLKYDEDEEKKRRAYDMWEKVLVDIMRPISMNARSDSTPITELTNLLKNLTDIKRNT